jgi:hypothetical protein
VSVPVFISACALSPESKAEFFTGPLIDQAFPAKQQFFQVFNRFSKVELDPFDPIDLMPEGNKRQ